MIKITVHASRVDELARLSVLEYGYINLNWIAGRRNILRDLDVGARKDEEARLRKVFLRMLEYSDAVGISCSRGDCSWPVRMVFRVQARNYWEWELADTEDREIARKLLTEKALSPSRSPFLFFLRDSVSLGEEFMKEFWDPAVIGNLKRLVAPSLWKRAKEAGESQVVLALFGGDEVTIFSKGAKMKDLVEQACSFSSISIPSYAEPEPK